MRILYNAAIDLLTRGIAAGGADKTAFVDGNEALTYGELARRAARAAAGLRELGVAPEQRVLLVMLDTVDFPVMFLGALLAGVVPVPVSTLLPSADYAYFLDDSRAVAVIASEPLVGKLLPVLGRRKLVVAGLPRAGEDASSGLGEGALSFEALLALCEQPPMNAGSGSETGSGSATGSESATGSGSGSGSATGSGSESATGSGSESATGSESASAPPSDPHLAAIHVVDRALRASGRLPPITTPDDVAFWLYSSGSTGQPKGAMHLHGSLRATADTYARQVLGITADDTVFSAAKLFFAYGLGNSLTFPMSAGATTALLSERPTPAAVVRTLRRFHPTIFCGVPTLYAALLADEEHRPDGASPALRRCVSAGEALPRHIGEHWQLRTGVEILDGIGSTEMLHIFLSNRPGEARYGSSGVPVPGYQVELRDERGQRLESTGTDGDADTEGALWVSGPSAAIAYWNQRERSLATFHGPWTQTGDRYRRDADGTYVYCGRNDDMLKVGGIWVAPFEVESALAAHPAVLEAAVVGQADGEGLIKPKAFVVLQEALPADAPGAAERAAQLIAELKAFVKDRLAPYKYPRWIELVAELPKTATGKIQRFRLR